jgi:hypothetical protein
MNTQTEFEYIGDYKMQESNCVAIAFTRITGSNPVSINGFPLAEGQTLRIEQNVGDVDRTQYNVQFTQDGVKTNECYCFRTLPLGQFQKDSL